MASVKERLLQLLMAPYEAARRPSRIACSSGPLSRVTPGLHIEGLGAVKVPLALTPAQLAALPAAREAAAAAGSNPAPGVTVVPASQFSTNNPRWEGEVVPEALRRAGYTLGFGKNLGPVVEARLSQLVLLEEGARLEFMVLDAPNHAVFAHLAILLPSAYAGGQLAMAHVDTLVTADLAGRNRASSCFAGFYTGCSFSVEPAVGGPRALLLYDLWHVGGASPPRLVNVRSVQLQSLATEWDEQASADAPKQLCFLLENRYSASALRERGVEALQGADKAAAQLVVAACERGAPLDAKLALLKVAARPGPTRDEVHDKILKDSGGYLCDSCGDWHFEFPEEEQAARQTATIAWNRVLHQNQGFNALNRLRWLDAKASKFAPLAGEAAPFRLTTLHPVTELLHRNGYWSRPPSHVMDEEEDEEDEDEDTQVFEVAGILLSPHSQRLRNAIHACLPGQAVRLHDMLQASAGAAASGPDEGVLQSLRDYKGYGLVCNWVGYLEEEGAGDGYSSSDSEGPGSNEEGGSDSDGAAIHRLPQVPTSPATTAAQLAEALTSYLEAAGGQPAPAGSADPGGPPPYTRAKVLVLLMSAAQLGDCQLALRLLSCAAGLSSYCVLSKSVAGLLQHFDWPAAAQASLRGWVNTSALFDTVTTGIILVQQLVAAGGADSGAHQAAAIVALSVAKGLRTSLGPYSDLYPIAKSPASLLQALHIVKSAGGRLAMDMAVDAIVSTYARTPAIRARPDVPTACAELLERLPPHSVAGSPALLRLVCACLDQFTASMGPPHETPANWTKTFIVRGHCYPQCERCLEVQAFLSSPGQQEATFQSSPCTDQWLGRMILNASYRNSPPYCDVAAVREVGGAGGELWRLTKSHVAYERKRAEYEGLVQKQRALLEGLVPCLQLLLPGARSGESGAAGGAPPPTKAACVSCSVQ